MTRNDHIPIASAEFLGEDSPSKTDDLPVQKVQVDSTGHRESVNQQDPAIHVAASNVMVDMENQPPSDTNTGTGNFKDSQDFAAVAAFRKRRKRRQKIAFVSGFVVGLVVCGPILGLLGGAAAHYITKRAGRSQQARMEEELHTKNDATVIAPTTKEEKQSLSTIS